jgi:hypothetical protein
MPAIYKTKIGDRVEIQRDTDSNNPRKGKHKGGDQGIVIAHKDFIGYPAIQVLWDQNKSEYTDVGNVEDFWWESNFKVIIAPEAVNLWIQLRRLR